MQLRFHILGKQLREFLWFYFPIVSDESTCSWGNPWPLILSDWLRCGQIWHNYSWRKSSWCRKGCMEIKGRIIIHVLILVITKGQTFLLQCCALRRFHVADGQSMRDQITRGRRSKWARSNCILCIPFILSGSPNQCWLHTCDTCVMTTWRLGLRAPLVARNQCTCVAITFSWSKIFRATWFKPIHCPF